MSVVKKAVTRAARRLLVRKVLEKWLTPDAVANCVAKAVSVALEATVGLMSEARVTQVVEGCRRVGMALIHISAAVDPNGQDGKRISVQEREQIALDLKGGLSSLLTQPALTAVTNQVVDGVK